MTEIHLLIPDAAVREAVAEQIVAAKLGSVVVADSAAALVKQADGQNPCVAILDAAVWDKKNAASLQAFAARAEKPALLVLGALDDVDGVTESFAKPLRLGHLLTRVRYHLETAPLLRDQIISFGPYRLEAQNRRVLRDGSDDVIRLTEKETMLLVFLAGSKEPATRRDILAGVWGYDERIDTHTLETHIYQLRRKLDGGGENWLVNENGAYRLTQGAAA